MEKKKVAIQFLCYSPQVYSGFDRYNLQLAGELQKRNISSVFVFTDSIKNDELCRDLKDANISIEFIPSEGRISIIIRLIRIFIKYKPAIVHSHFENLVQFVTSVLSFSFRSNFYVSFHSLLSPHINAREYRRRKGLMKFFVLRLYYNFLIISSKKVVCISSAIRDQFYSFSGSNSDKIIVSYLGVKIRTESGTGDNNAYNLQDNEKKVIIANVSAIEPIKGIDIFIEAVSILKHKYNLTGFMCYHIGGPRSDAPENLEYKEYLSNLVQERGIADVFVFLGQRNDIDKLLSSTDIYVHPSRMEGLSVSIMEACVHYIPVVGSKVGGIPEIVHNDINGFLFPDESSSKLAIILKSLITDKDLRNHLGKEGFRIAAEKFNLDKQVERQVLTYTLKLKKLNLNFVES